MSPSAPSAPGALAIRVERVSRVFDGGVAALRDVDLSVPAGQFVAMIGPSGCGKSTLLRLVAGLDHASEGTVATEGQGDAAFVFQDPHLMPWRNVLRNVELPLELRGVPGHERRTAALAALEQVGLGEAIRRYPAQLSGGMRMRASLARAMVTQPQLLLLDEPFAAVDEITRFRLDEMLYNLWAQRGMTVLFVTHSIPEAVYLAHRVVVFTPRPGRIFGDVAIDLPRDGTSDPRDDPRFHDAIRRLAHLLREAGGDA